MNIAVTREILRLRSALDKVRSAAKSQREVGNHDIAEHFDSVAKEAENLIFDIAAMAIENPNLTPDEIKQYLEKLYK